MLPTSPYFYIIGFVVLSLAIRTTYRWFQRQGGRSWVPTKGSVYCNAYQ